MIALQFIHSLILLINIATSNKQMSKHIMLSYQRNSTNLVSNIYEYLSKHQSIPVWMDQHGGIKEYLSASLAEGVENSCVLVCFLTPEYQDSEYCKKELRYASELRKPIIPILVGSDDKTSKWRPSQWLGFTITDLIYLDFTHIDGNNLDKKSYELLEKINSILGITQTNIVSQSQIIQNENEEEEKEEEEDFETNSPPIVSSIIRHGPQIDEQIETIIPKKYSSEGDSVIRLLNQSTEIQANQDLYSRNGSFLNSFTLSRFIFQNTSSESISILQLSSEYQDQNKQWISCQIKTNLTDDLIQLDPNKLVVCSITIQIKLQGEPGIDNQHRFRAHRLLPQPLIFKISIEDTQMKHSSLIIEQVNKPLDLPTLNKLMNKFNLSESNILGYVWCDDCLIDLRYFLLISYSNDEDTRIQFCFGCDLSSYRRPSWTKRDIQTLQKTAKIQNKNQLIVHEDIMNPYFDCKVLFDQQFKLNGIKINIQTKTSTIEQIIPLRIKEIFTEISSF